MKLFSLWEQITRRAIQIGGVSESDENVSEDYRSNRHRFKCDTVGLYWVDCEGLCHCNSAFIWCDIFRLFLAPCHIGLRCSLGQRIQSDCGHMYFNNFCTCLSKQPGKACFTKKGRGGHCTTGVCFILWLWFQRSRKQSDMYVLQNEDHEDIMCTI